TRGSPASTSLGMNTVCPTANPLAGTYPTLGSRRYPAAGWMATRPLAQYEPADGADQDEEDRRGEEAGAGEEAESHRQKDRRADQRSVFRERDEGRVGPFMLWVVHLRARFD